MTAIIKPLHKIHLIAMARHAGLVVQEGQAVFVNDLAGEKEVIAFARMVERTVLGSMEERVEQPALLANDG